MRAARPARTPSGSGTTGVDIGNPISRLLFALRFGDFNLLISGQLTDDSQILFRRDIEERVREIAPFLAYDHDPVPRQRRRPPASGSGTPTPSPIATRTRSRCGEDSRFAGANYVRNSVKVVVDAYNGDGPLLPGRSRRADRRRLRAHLPRPVRAARRDARGASRPTCAIPEDLFVAQNQAFRLYHLPATDGGRVDLLQPGRPLGDPART